MNYIAIDLGTTGCKTALYSGGALVKTTNEEYPLYVSGRIAEQDAADWWECVKSGILALGGGKTLDVDALCVSAQGIAFVPVSASGEVLYRAISWLDKRAENELSAIEKALGADYIFETTGKRMSVSYTLPKLIWVKDNLPEIYAKTHKFLFPSDFINYKLTGGILTDYTIASGSMAFDINALKWSDKILRATGIDAKKLPEVSHMGAHLGRVTSAAARELNIAGGASVILGGQDQKLAALGAGADNTRAAVSLGTATAVSSFAQMKHCAVFAFDGGKKIYESSIGTTGAAIKWLKNFLGVKSYADLDIMAEKAGTSAGAGMTLNFMTGAQINGLSLATSAGNVIYALYESIADGINGFLTENVKQLLLYGGGASSDILCRIIKERTKKSAAVLDTNETACLGAAMLASGGKISAAKIIKNYY